jgi:hypothetical protein
MGGGGSLRIKPNVQAPHLLRGQVTHSPTIGTDRSSYLCAYTELRLLGVYIVLRWYFLRAYMKCTMLVGIVTYGTCAGSEQSVRQLRGRDITVTTAVRGNRESLTGTW